MTNAANPATFTLTADANVYGIFVIGARVQGTGVLLSAHKFTTMRPLLTGDEISVIYSVSAASA
jgi:hypothetical protein